MLRLALFGGLRACVGEEPLAGRAAQRKRMALLALLGAAPTGGLTRDKLTGLLWPECDTEKARHQLAAALYDLRRAAGQEIIVSAGEELRLAPERAWSDVREFDAALASGDRQRAVRLYTGPLLDGFFLSGAPEFERWVDAERDRLARSCARALEELATAAGSPAASVQWLRQLAAQDPCNSRVALALMRALAAAGDRAGALQHASIHAALLKEELGAEAAPEVVTLAERLRSGEPDAASSMPPSRDAAPLMGSGAGSPPANATRAPGVAPDPSEETLTGAAPRLRPFRGRVRRRVQMAGAIAACTVALAFVLSLLPNRSDAVPTGQLPVQTLAVLPLKNDTGDEGQEHFVDAMTEALITELARESDLRVISRTSVRRYKDPADRNLPQIARELNADVIVEGSVFRDGDQVRITAQLIRAPTDEHLWAESYDGSARDIFALQARVARAVAQQIGVRLAHRGDSPTASSSTPVHPAAYEAYVRGRASGGRKSIEALQEAIRLDPEFAPAYATLADRLAILGFFGFLPPDSAFGSARKAALQALARNGELAEAHGALGIVLLHHDWNWPGAEKHFRRALALNPSSAYLRHMFAHQLLAHGRNAESARESARAAQLDPFNASLIACSGWHGLAHGQHEMAVRESVRALRLEPESFWPEMILGWAYEQVGRYPEAITAFRDAVSHSGGSSFALASQAHAHAAAGEERKARGILAELLGRRETQYVSAYEIAAVYAGLGERENALLWLERAYGERSSFLINLAWEPRFRTLHADPRFGELIRKVGLPQRPRRA